MLLLLLACASEPTNDESPPVDDGAQWDELSEDDSDGDTDGKGDDTGKGGADDTGKDSWPECGDDVEEGAPCQGDWSTTTCLDEKGEYWWCEGGVWTTGK